MASEPSSRTVPSVPGGGRALARDTAWNAALNVAVAGLSACLLALSSHWAGEYWCGVVALGLAMSQQLFTLGNFTMGSYQASDVAEKRSFGDYVAAKSVTVGAMLLAGAAWAALGGFGRDKTLAFAALLVCKAFDAFSNAFFARYQQRGRLDISCKVRLAKTTAFAGLFAAVLWTVRNPLPALAAGAAAEVGLFFVLDLPLLKRFGPLEWRWPGRAAWTVLGGCAPLALNSFLVMYVNNGPRFAVDAVLDEGALAVFSALFMASFGVAVCGDFLMNPQVTRLAAAVAAGDRARAQRIVLRQAGLISGLGLAGLAAAAAIGLPVLERVFALDLTGRLGVLLVLLGGGVLVASYHLAQTVLVVVRRQVWGVPGMALAVVAVFFCARPAVARAGLSGAAAVYSGAVALMALCSSVFAVRFFRAAFRERAM